MILILLSILMIGSNAGSSTIFCTELTGNWDYDNDSYLSGEALDQKTHRVMYDDLHTAQLACVNQGTGCGGVTGHHHSTAFSLRYGTSFMRSPTDEYSYIKPANPCIGMSELKDGALYIISSVDNHAIHHKLDVINDGKHGTRAWNTYDLKDSQIWMLERGGSSAWYIVNNHHRPARLMFGGRTDDPKYNPDFNPDSDNAFAVKTTRGERSIDQQWYISHATGNPAGMYFTINNRKYPDFYLGKSYDGELHAGQFVCGLNIQWYRKHYRNIHKKSLWKVEGLFSKGVLNYERIIEKDNRNGNKDMTISSEISVGITTTTTTTMTTEILSSIKVGLEGIGEMDHSIKQSLSHEISNGRTEIHTVTKTYTIAAGENFWVCRPIVTMSKMREANFLTIKSTREIIKGDMC